jgi:hypothetical protein
VTRPSRAGGFDRLRARTPAAESHGAATTHDTEGKRALFSAASPDAELPGATGSVTIDCARCGERTPLSLMSAVRAAFPSLLLSIGIGHGDGETTIGLVPRRHGAFLRCPACGRPTWTRITVRL